MQLNAQAIAAAPRKRPGHFQPRGQLFDPLPPGEVSGYPMVRGVLEQHRAKVPSVDVVRLSSLFAVSTVRVTIEKAEESFLCFTKLYEARQRQRQTIPSVAEIKKCFRGLQNSKSKMFSEVAAYAPVIQDAIRRGLKDRELRKYLVRETPLPTGLGVAKMSFTLALLGHDCVCLDTRLMARMFGGDALKVAGGWGHKSDGRVSDLSLGRYEAAEDAFLKGNRYYVPGDPLGRARAQWQAWESTGGKGATHGVWLNVVTKDARHGMHVVGEDVEADRRKTVRIYNLICARTSIQQAFADVARGAVSRTTGPLSVWYAPEYAQQPVRGYMVVDGWHRLVEQLLRGTAAPFTWEEVEVKQIGSGYSDYWATPAPEDRVVFAMSRYGGLESIIPFERLEAVGQKLASSSVADAPVEDRKQGAYRGWEHRRERDEFVTQNLSPELLPLWRRIGSSFRGTPEERYEAFMQYVHDHPDDSIEATQSSADRKLDMLIQQRMAGAPARRFSIDEQVLVRPKFSRGFPQAPGVIHDIRNGKYEIVWSNGESGWFSSSDLRRLDDEGAQAPIARATEETIQYRGIYFDIVTSGGIFVRIGEERLKNAGPFDTREDAIQAAHTHIDEMLDGVRSGDVPLSGIGPPPSDTVHPPRGLPQRPKPPNPVTLAQLAAAFLSDIENPRSTSYSDYLKDERVPKIISALTSLDIKDGIGPVLGHGAFGTATVLPDGRILKLTSDPTETQAAYVLTGKKLPHVVEIYGAWFVRGVKVRATLSVDENSRPIASRKWPMGISIVERVTPLDRTTSGFQGLTGTVMTVKRELRLFPEYLTKLGPARARTLLKQASEKLEEVLRDNGKWLRKNDMVDDAYLAEGVADALKETRALGVYAIDVHGGNVGYVEDAQGDRVYKIFDIGSSSAPRAPSAPTVPAGGPARGRKKEDATIQLPFPGMLAEPQPVPWVGDGRDVMEAPSPRRRRA